MGYCGFGQYFLEIFEGDFYFTFVNILLHNLNAVLANTIVTLLMLGAKIRFLFREGLGAHIDHTQLIFLVKFKQFSDTFAHNQNFLIPIHILDQLILVQFLI